MSRWRYRLARWLVGPFFRLTESGSWIVNHDAAAGTTFAIRLTEWSGTVTTQLPALKDYGTGDFPRTRTEGTFTGKYVQ